MVVSQVQLPQARETPNRVGQRQQPVAGDSELDQAGHTGNAFGQRFEGVVADVQVAQLRQPLETRRQRSQPVVVKVKKIGEPVEVGQGIRHGGQLVVPKIEHAQLHQAADLLLHFGEIIVGQDQDLEIDLIPHRFGDAAEPLLPQAELLTQYSMNENIASPAATSKYWCPSSI